MSAVLQVNSLSRHFGPLVAVDDVSFDVAKGAIFGLLGPNGSGKSTIIRMLLGILPPTSGSARVLGFDAETQAEIIKPRIGYMSQQFSLYADLSVSENILFYGRVYGLNRAELDKRLRAVVDLTGIGDRLDQLAGTLSGGWKQRLALACSLVHQPDVLFLDEPTAGIDPVARRDLWDLLFELSSRGVTLLVTTHYMDEAERCTDVGYLFMSKLLVLGKPDELKLLPQVTPAGTVRYELRVAEAAHQLAALRRVAGVHDATMFGERIHLLIDDKLDPGELRELLKLEKNELSVRPADPTLEDVFVTLTRAAEAQAEQSLVEHGAAPRDLGDTNGTRNDGESGATHHSGSHVGENASSEATANERPDAGEDFTAAGVPRSGSSSARGMRGWYAVLAKEFVHIRRQPSTLFFMLVVPVIQTVIFGYAVNTQIEYVPTVVWDLDGRTQAQLLVETFQNTRRFRVVEKVNDQSTFDSALRSGRGKSAS